jgi:CDGSH-type Zn-finger protein
MMTVTVRENGPYVVESDDVMLVDWHGQAYRPVNRARCALCRCGAATTKPFGEGTHSRVGFKAEGAVEQRTQTGESGG